jgi:hypothetical protein
MRLIINNQEVDLPTNLSVKYNRSSSIFAPLQGEWSLPIVLPLSDYNNLIFDYPAQANIANNPRKEYKAQLWIESYLLSEGIVTIQNVTRKTLSITFKSMPGNISANLWKKKLNEFDLGAEVIPTIEKTSNFYYQLKWDSFNLLNNIVFFGADYFVAIEVYADNTLMARSHYTGYTRVGFNPTDADLKKRLYSSQNSMIVRVGDVTVDDKGIYCKLDRIGYTSIVVKFVCLPIGSDIELVSSGRYAKTMTKITYITINETYYNNKINNTIYALPEIQNYKFYERIDDWNGIINARTDNKIQLNDDASQTRNCVIPQLKLPWVFKELLKAIGYTQTGSFLQNADILKLLILSLYATDKQCTEVTISFNVHNETIKYANHLPNLTLSEFFQALIDQFALGMEFNPLTKNVEIFFVKDIFTDNDYLDLSDRVSFEFNSEFNELKKKQLRWFTSGDELATEEEPIFQPYPLDKDIENEKDQYQPLECKFPSLTVAEIDGKRQIPEIEMLGISPLFGQSNNQQPTRLMFWNGTIAENKTANMSISFQGANNLYTKLQAPKIAFDNNHIPRKCKTLLTLQELIAFSFKRKILAYGVFYYAEEISTELNKSSQEFEVEMKLRRYLPEG